MAGRELFSHVAVEGGSFAAFAVGFIGHRMHSGGVDPAVIEIEEGADGDGVVDRVVGPAGFVERLHIFGADVGGSEVHFGDEAQQGFFFFGQSGGFQIAEDAPDQFFTA
jgi:hypothetical protein